MKKIIVIAEHIQGQLRPVTRELICCAHGIAGITGGEIVTVLPYGEGGGDDHYPSLVGQVRAMSDTHVMGLVIRGAAHPDAAAFKEHLIPLMQELDPGFIVAGHTSQGLDLAPGLAVRLNAPCISGVNALGESKGKPQFVRSLFKGKINGVVALKEPVTPVVLTVQAGMFLSCPLSHAAADSSADMVDERQKKMKSGPGVCSVEIDGKKSEIPGKNLHCSKKEVSGNPQQNIQYGKISQTGSSKSKLDQARVIIAGGRGIESLDNIEYLQELTRFFSASAVAGSRPLIDMGWLPYEQQVGITGAVVAPDLYMAVGISGSSQHIAGMAQSKFIVSVNQDPHAAIFNVSDICIVEDALNFVKTIIFMMDKKEGSNLLNYT